MTVQNDLGITRPAAGALSAFRLVTQDANGRAAYCAVSTVRDHLGTVQNNPTAIDQETAIRLAGGSRTCKVVASVAITINAEIYYAANGKVGLTSASNTKIGRALEAAAGDGSVIEALIY